MTTDRTADAPSRRRLYQLLGAAGVLLVSLLVVWWPGCRQYPAVSSRESLSLLRQLNTACNTRDDTRLAEVERRLAELNRQGKVTPEEKAGYDRIIGMARAGKWDDAEKAALKFAQDQVGQGDGTADRPADHEPSSGKKHPPR